jgi:hypothetical protein
VAWRAIVLRHGFRMELRPVCLLQCVLQDLMRGDELAAVRRTEFW